MLVFSYLLWSVFAVVTTIVLARRDDRAVNRTDSGVMWVAFSCQQVMNFESNGRRMQNYPPPIIPRVGIIADSDGVL